MLKLDETNYVLAVVEKSIKNFADDKLNRETKISLLFYAVFLYLICFHSFIHYFGGSTFIL